MCARDESSYLQHMSLLIVRQTKRGEASDAHKTRKEQREARESSEGLYEESVECVRLGNRVRFYFLLWNINAKMLIAIPQLLLFLAQQSRRVPTMILWYNSVYVRLDLDLDPNATTEIFVCYFLTWRLVILHRLLVLLLLLPLRTTTNKSSEDVIFTTK